MCHGEHSLSDIEDQGIHDVNKMVAFLSLCEKETLVPLRFEMAQILQRTSHRICQKKYFFYTFLSYLHRFVSNGGLRTLRNWLTSPDSTEELLKSLLISLMNLVFLMPLLPEVGLLLEDAKRIVEVLCVLVIFH